MSLAQAFQTAAAYRQGIIDQNQQAAMQTPMLAVQALSVGLQAQAQQQDMQFKMQSMVLQTQLQIEETKTKQAMQLMEFDLYSRKLNLQEQQSRQEYEWKKQEFAANQEFNALRLAQEKSKVLSQRNETLADTFLGAQFAKGVTQEQLLLGADPEGMAEFAQTYPEAAAVLGTRLNNAREATKADLSGQIATLALARDKALFDSKASPQTRALAEEYYGKQLQPLEDRVAAIEKRPARDMSRTGIGAKMAAFGSADQGLDPKTAIDALAEIRQTMTTLDPVADKEQVDALRTRQESLLNSLVPMPRANTPTGPTPLQTALAEATAARAKLQTTANRNRNPSELVQERATSAALSNLDAWEGTVGAAIAPTLDSVINTSGDTAQVAEAQKLRNIMDAALEATRRGITGIPKRDWMGWNDGATATRELAPTESRPYPVFGGPGVPAPPAQTMASTQVRSFTRAELDSLAQDPSYENVKRILSRLEVR